jgi:hypothetical protein
MAVCIGGLLRDNMRACSEAMHVSDLRGGARARSRGSRGCDLPFQTERPLSRHRVGCMATEVYYPVGLNRGA